MVKIPIVILHGWNLDSSKYTPLKTALQIKGYKVFCFDMPGFGNAPPLKKDYTIMDYGSYVLEKINRNNLENVIIIGHSFGGRVGIYLSIYFPEKVSRLVISGTPALDQIGFPKKRIFYIIAKLGNLIFSLPVLKIFKTITQRILYRLAGSYDYLKVSGLLRKSFKNIIAYKLEPELQKIDQPTLIIWGDEDKIVPKSIAIRIHKRIKKSRLKIIPGAGHGVLWTHSAEIVEYINNFINTI